MRYRFPLVGADLRKPTLYTKASTKTARPHDTGWTVGVSRDLPVYSPGFWRVLIPA